MALLNFGSRSLSPVKRKKREHPAVVTDMSLCDAAAASSATPSSPAASRAAAAGGGQAAADGLLRRKKICKQLAGSRELRSVLAPLAAAGGVSPSGAAGLLAPTTPHAPQHEQPQQQQTQRQQKGEVKLLEDLLLRGRLPVLRSCLLPSPSPSLRTLVLERLAVEAAAFPAAFSPFQLLSTSAAPSAAGDEGKSSPSAGEAEDNHEGKALVSFLTLLKDAIETAPAAAVSFDAEGRIRGRRTAVLLKHVVQPAAAPHSSSISSRSGDSSSSRSGDSSSSRSGDSSSSRSGDSSSSRSGDSSSISSKDGKGVRGSNVTKSSRKGKKGIVGGDEGNKAEVEDKQIGEERIEEDKRKGEHWSAFTFEAPVAVHVVGSFPLNLTSSFSKNVDVCVMMPAHMFGSRDHINYRYFNKRSVYIQLLYEHLRDIFIALFPSGSAATAPACSSSSADPRREGLRVAARGPSGADPLPASASTPARTTPATQASSVAIAAACTRCAASAAAFRSVAPQVVPRVFLQAWQGCVEKPVIAVRFIAVQQQQGDAGKQTSSPGSSERRVSLLQQQEQRTLQQQQLLKQWIVRVLAVPSTETAEPNAKQQQQRSKTGESSLLTSSRKEASSRGERRKLFADHLLAVDRNCVRVPTTCCRSLSSLLTPVSAAADEEEKAGVVQEQEQDTENLPPTPYYNMLLLEDLRLRQHQRLLYRCCRLYGGGFREAVLLLKLWALRRGLLAADATCLSPHVATTSSSVPAAADEDVFCWKETSDVSGFLLAMLCCHACLAATDSLTTPLLAQQLLTLTLSFLAEANFLQSVYILGDRQPYRRQQDLKTLRIALGGGGSTLAEDGAAAAVERRRITASSLVGEETKIQTAAEGKEPAIADSLAIGLLDEAYLFDSPSCCFNVLWRAQLHVAELQQEARSSLQALQRSVDAFHFVFAPPPSASSARISINSNSSSEHAHLYGLLQGDVQLYIPQVPQQPHLYFPASAYPLGNYLPFAVRQQRPRGDAAGATVHVAPLNAAAAAAGGSSSYLAAIDATPKWETPQPALLGSSVLRLFVRGLGDRLRCYRVRLRRACCPLAAATGDTGVGARLHAEADPETYTATDGQLLAWTAESAEDFLKRGAAATGLVISLELNAATAARLVERGPSAAVTAFAAAAPPAAGATNPGITGAAAEAVESFKLFWGPTRVEVRRFHDAQTLFAVVWQRPSAEEEQLQALLCHRSADFATVTAPAAAPFAAVPSQPHHSAGGRFAAGAAGSFPAAALQSREQQLLVHPPPHTQVIRHVLQRHLSHLLLLKQGEDESQQHHQHHQQQHQHQHQQQGNLSTCQRGLLRHTVATRKKSNSKDSNATSNTPVLDARVCFLESTPLGAVPSLSQRHKQLIQTFNELRNTICALSSLPLAIKQIWHAGAALRFADALPLPDSGGPSTVAPDALDCGLHRVVVEFEDSAAWPDDVVAMRHVKIAFLLAMRKELLSDHGIYGVVSPCAFLDVELGLFTFRIIIFHPAEAAGAAVLYAEPRWEPLYSYLRERSRHSEVVATTHSNSSNSSSSSDSSSQPRSVSRGSRRKKGFGQQQEATGDEVAVAEAQQQVQQHLSSLFNSIDTEDEDAVLARPFASPLFARKYLDAAQQQEEERRLSCLRCMWWEPQVAAVLHACALRYPAFAGCVRLAKRWMAEMQLPACMHLLEHIVTSLFVETGKWGFPAPPQSVHVAFLRFLYVVTSFDWADAPFIVCFDSDAPLGTQREQMMKLSFEKFRRYPSVQSLFDPHGFIIPLPDATTFTRFVHTARYSLASITRIPLCPSLASSIWKGVFSFDEWSSMDFILFLRKDFSVTETKRNRKRYANDFRPTSLPSSLASVSFGSGETAAVTQLLMRAAASSEQHVEGLGSNANQPGARMLFSPSYVRRFLFLRFLRELLCSVWTANEGAFRALEPTLLGMHSTVSLAYNPLKAALQGGGMPGVVGIKLNAARAGSGGFSLFLARSVQPSVTFPRCCFSIENIAGEHGARKAEVDGGGRKVAAVTEECGSAAGRSLEVDCLNPVLLMAGFFAAGGELVESIQLGGC